MEYRVSGTHFQENTVENCAVKSKTAQFICEMGHGLAFPVVWRVPEPTVCLSVSLGAGDADVNKLIVAHASEGRALFAELVCGPDFEEPTLGFVGALSGGGGCGIGHQFSFVYSDAIFCLHQIS